MKIAPVFLFIFLFNITNNLRAQSYNVGLIPDSLMKNANAVKRAEEVKIVIQGINKATVYHKYAITIFNESGDRYATYDNFYNKFIDLSNISGNLYDASGKLVRSVKQKDVQDHYNDQQMTLITDTRYKEHDFFYKQYPYTVEYSDEQQYNGFFNLRKWSPQQSNVMSIVQSRFVVETPVNYELRYKQLNYAYSPTIQNSADEKIYTWEIRNKAAFEWEVFSPSLEDITPSVYLAPVNFQIEGYLGSMKTWKDFGKFVATLNAGKDVLPANVKSDVHALVDGLKDVHQKAVALYEYMQKNTRYINVSIGIGGWQPFDATYVATKKYGDCKALSNFMKSLLEEAGITAYYVLVQSGDDEMRGLWEDFPAPFFNHAVVCMPNGKDTTWFECTDQTASAGYMDDFVGNRKALLIKDDGGYVVRTPVYSEKTNRLERKVSATIDEGGNLRANLFTRYFGIEQNVPNQLVNAAKEARDRYLNEVINLPSYEVQDVKYVEIKKSVPEVDETLQLKAEGYATITGKRIFLKPNLFNKNGTTLDEEKTRHFPIEYPFAFDRTDSIELTIPDGFIAEAKPKDVQLSSKFGSYSMTILITGNKINLVRNYTRVSGIFPASDFKELAEFNNKVYKADRGQVVMVKN
ncbi:MAG: DUF3857 domain-containing protein [Chitinophagaceae bacterium]